MNRLRNIHRAAWVVLPFLAVFGCQPPASDSETSEPTPVETVPVETAPTVSAPVAATQYGAVRGFVEDEVLVFKGVRYGADTAATRFGAPDKPAARAGVRDTVEYGPSCPQVSGAGRMTLFDSWVPEKDPGQSEDCLFLNVWTPALDLANRPVMVWLHGGGFSSGSGSSNVYDGVRLVNRGDVVVVTVNHRLNLFGYLHLDSYGERFSGSGTAGMMDLVLALEWVKDNIANFGGNSDNVMIFGESGGGWKVSTLMAMDAAKGLFHRAVAQSGPGLEAGDPEAAGLAADALVAELGFDRETIDQILDLPAEQLYAAAAKVIESGKRPGARPVVDGINLHRHPFSPDAPEQSIGVPLLIGSTKTEMTMLAGGGRPELFELAWEELPGALEKALAGIDGQEVVDGYRALHPGINPKDLYFEVLTDHSGFGRGSFTLADRKAAQGGAAVYQYYLAWPTPVDDGKWAATHALDLGFVFDNVAKSESMSGVGEFQQALADVMSEAWLAFARSGNPNHDGLPAWPEYDATDRATMIFDDAPRVGNDPRGRERAIIDAALPSTVDTDS